MTSITDIKHYDKHLGILGGLEAYVTHNGDRRYIVGSEIEGTLFCIVEPYHISDYSEQTTFKIGL